MRLTFAFIEWVEWVAFSKEGGSHPVIQQPGQNKKAIRELCDLNWDICLLLTLDNESQCRLIVSEPSNSGELKLSAILGPILWPPDADSWLIGNDPDAGKDWKQKEEGMTNDKMIGWHHQWTWTWANGRWWGIGKPGVLQNMGLQSQTQLGYWTTNKPWVPYLLTEVLGFSHVQKFLVINLSLSLYSINRRWMDGEIDLLLVVFPLDNPN